MSTEPDDADGDRPRRAYRTVTPPYRGRGDFEMDAIGWAIMLGMVVLLLPLLPFLLIVWGLAKLLDRAG